MRKYWKLVGAAAMLAALGACDHVRQHNVSRDGNELTVVEGNMADHLTLVGKRDSVDPVVCMSPSPDAIKATALSLAAGGGTPKAGGNAALGTSTSSAFVGLRNQTVQLLRDGYYRLCEAYINKAISREQYNLAIVNMPQVFALMMTIDAVAGAAIAPAVVIRPNQPGVSAATNLSVTDGTDGSESQANASTASVTGASGGEAFSATLRGPAINEHSKAVLVKALEVADSRTLLGFCASLLADSDNPDPSGALSSRATFLAHCNTIFQNYAAQTSPNAVSTKLSGDIAKLQSDVAKMAKALGSISKPTKELSDLQKKMNKLAEDLARESVKQPKVVAVGK